MLNTLSIYHRLGIAAFLCLCQACPSFAQQLFTVKGVIFKKNSPITISYVNISNKNRKVANVTSDDLGSFHIEASMGDTLLFNKADYTTQFIVVQNYSPQSIYMQPVIHLNEVSVKDISKKQELNNALDDYKKKGQYYTLNPSVMSVITSPLSGLYELFGKGPAQARKFQKYSKEELERIEIAKRYNKPLVKKITNMPDEDLEDFMLNFTPNVEDIRTWADYDIIDYIKRSYAYFAANKGSMKLQKLY